jgi:hypothetical protein
MPVAARRVFRLAFTVALALAFGYALALPVPFLAPLFALLLAAAPAPPIGLKGLAGLVLVVLLTLGCGLLLIPMITHYPVTGVLLVALGLYFSAHVTLNLGRGLVGSLLTVGVTLISAAGSLSYLLAITVIQSLVAGIAVAVFCHWLVYPWFPEDAAPAPKAGPKPPAAGSSGWNALRTTLIVLPAYLLVLTNPSAYMAVIMKSVSLSQQGSLVRARDAGRELLDSTFLAGCFAVLFWFALSLAVNLWMFTLWMLLFGVYFAAKLYGVLPSRFPASFWQNTAVTMLILLGPAVQDSANGKDVYAAFAVRMGLFIAVTLYAWLAIALLERLRQRHLRRRSRPALPAGSAAC